MAESLPQFIFRESLALKICLSVLLLRSVLKEMFSIIMIFEVAAILFIIGLLFILPIYNMQASENVEGMLSKE